MISYIDDLISFLVEELFDNRVLSRLEPQRGHVNWCGEYLGEDKQ